MCCTRPLFISEDFPPHSFKPGPSYSSISAKVHYRCRKNGGPSLNERLHVLRHFSTPFSR
ncbi:hypothetical protein C8R44DRAFT_792023, partial [Mycena epipterygia]